jgi:metal-sulfur cluster biosynthetic enzyme
MPEPITEEEIWKAVSKVNYPALDKSLVDLNMIKDLKVKITKVIVTIAVPFPSSRIINKLVRKVKEPIENLGFKAEVKVTLMSKEDREKFLNIERDTLKGL